MSRQAQNSAAAVLSGLTGVVMWLIGIGGVIGAGVLITGLLASLSGGEASLSGIQALAEGVTPSQFIIALGGLAIGVPGAIYICVLLRNMLSTLAAGDPFVPQNASRLMRISVVIALMEIFRYLSVFVVWLLRDQISGIEPRLSINLTLWVSVAALFILSQVFREGTRLRDEEKMTI